MYIWGGSVGYVDTRRHLGTSTISEMTHPVRVFFIMPPGYHIMYRRAAFYSLGLPIRLTNILNEIMRGEKKWTINDLKDPIQKIEFELSILDDSDDTNYVLSCIVEAQERRNKDAQYITVRSRLHFLFLLKQNAFVVLGKERYVNRTIREMTKSLFPNNTENLVLFNSTPLNKDAIMAIIRSMRKNDQRSCSAFNAKHDPDVQAEIENANNMNPHYKFYCCPQLTTDTYKNPKTICFSDTDGTIGTSIPFEFERWYAFIVNFLLPNDLIP